MRPQYNIENAVLAIQRTIGRWLPSKVRVVQELETDNLEVRIGEIVIYTFLHSILLLFAIKLAELPFPEVLHFFV
jgi:hypothetical protein